MDVNRVSDLCQFCASTMNLLVQISRSLNYNFKLQFYLNYLRFSFKLILQQIYNLMGRFFSTTFFLIHLYMLWKDIILKKNDFCENKMLTPRLPFVEKDWWKRVSWNPVHDLPVFKSGCACCKEGILVILIETKCHDCTYCFWHSQSLLTEGD